MVGYLVVGGQVFGILRIPSPATLVEICIKKTCDFLRSGAWENYDENPFSFMPTSLVQALLSSMLPKETVLSRASINHSRLLLTSGRLEDVDVCGVKDVEDYAVLLQMLYYGCQNLRRLSLLWEYDMAGIVEVKHALQVLLHNCTKLKYLHSNIYFEPRALQNCRTLGSLRLHFSLGEIKRFFSCVTFPLFKHLGSIEAVTLCQCNPRLAERNAVDLLPLITGMLQNCPRLNYVGLLDSSVALKELHDNDLRAHSTFRRFQLRRCYWKDGRQTTQSEIRDTIRVAALSCPLVEVLELAVRDAGGLQHLQALRNLTALKLRFDHCDSEINQEFYSLLCEIGHQLKHLSVSGIGKAMNLSIIGKNCPNLISLRLQCRMTTDETDQSHTKLLRLERLKVFHCNLKCLVFLLSDCLHLKAMCLDSCQALDDSTLQTILRRNSLSELESIFMDECSLSKSGWTWFVQSAVKLRDIHLVSLDLRDEVMRCMWDLSARITFPPSRDYFKHVREQFPSYFTQCPSKENNIDNFFER